MTKIKHIASQLARHFFFFPSTVCIGHLMAQDYSLLFAV